MIATGQRPLPENQRVVITGIGLTAPNGNDWHEFREGLLNGRSGVTEYEIRYVGSNNAVVSRYSPELICSSREVKLTPAPDRILVCGKYTGERFARAGWKQNTLALWNSPRHQSLSEKPAKDHEISEEDILVILPMDYLSSRELLLLLKSVSGRVSNKFLIKAHPFSNPSLSEICLREPQYAFGSKDLQNYIFNYQNIIYTGVTTTVCEALRYPKNIAQFKSTNVFSFDVINDELHLFTVFSSTSELIDLCNSQFKKPPQPSPLDYDYFLSQGSVDEISGYRQ